ncbi:hypothetical protein AUEXF2481DRAFT_35596 [Aureobasidium subglaciale EXF-2481]|uniref:Uncharacterized protein n=1 Tax=Aureobasidium subglaciale (strain EXF-2481) TaxID=1043005 RepID=A0A074YZX3_AURSE|nr:uncharacterized protein AUEXF2481DRAFT_35596 [Aureobasidium subglaciale EXF-2481]KAI5204598.1 hypothetical protein E4T38_04660 [Aureobasidium subglaciale]KAI5223821.1 hypothetical protein E4T40_04436 [Aureobasidium subglaciale]KAI5227084.1 hypothetical protein E4T41_04437 [Aureobasidium subglaciale]KAI5262593.1 hypothetical protein E4T46_04323 [Aureobasidium subglaciale]KEQ99677.1 hypothetical protein AUEXF2481DRAFT_35596 [Aureobasidium subglaciale EXF-2481]
METTHRKIELQSPLDLLYLSKNATKTVSEKLDLHFPPSAAPASASDDPLRTRVQELVDAYITTVFENARPNLSINGLEGKEMEEARVMAEGEGEELEPYDTKLAQKLQKLSAQVENLTLQLANLRRTAPAQAAAAYATKLEDEERLFEDARKRAEEERNRHLQEEGVRLGVENIRDWDECERNWEVATKRLVDVKESIGATSARLVQARDAAAYLDQVGK